MKQIKRLIIVIIVTLPVFFIINRTRNYCLLIDDIPKQRYFWMFQNNITKDLKIENASGNFQHSKFHFSYNYRNLFRYLILEDSMFNTVSLSEILYLNSDIDSNKRYIHTAEGFETWEEKHMKITSNLCTNLSDKISLNFNKEAIISQQYSTNKLSLECLYESVLFKNQDNKTQYLLKYDTASVSEIIFYKPKNKLYIIIITPFNNKIDIHKGVENLSLY